MVRQAGATPEAASASPGFWARVLVKALALFTAANLLFALWAPAGLGRVSAYNHLFPGRLRFPFGETPREAYNFSLFDLDAMFASHRVVQGKAADEYRVFLLGDSSVWGTLLRPEETLAGQLNEMEWQVPDGRRVVFYNLGYPTLSLFKDRLLLEEALRYEPDLVVWLVTLESFPLDKQLSVPLVVNNPERAAPLAARFPQLAGEDLIPPGLWERTVIGRRKDLADLIRLQVYGILWAATGIDQAYPADYPRAQIDLEADATYQGKESLDPGDLASFVIRDAAQVLETRGVPLLVVNEPILISAGENSEIRYNYYYPRGVYDAYRAWLAGELETAAQGKPGLRYLDAWDIVPPEEFTNSAIHIDRQGTGRLAGVIREEIVQIINR